MSRAIYRPSGEILGRPRPGGLYMWALAIVVGVLASFGFLLILNIVDYVQFLAFRAPVGRLSSTLVGMPWWSRLIGPIVGGAIILLLRLGISMLMGTGPAALWPAGCRAAQAAARHDPLDDAVAA